jgi:hypothetical protein
MPKHEIDYSNTIIYKITCKDSIVSDLYVGHTTNFVQRKHAHKQSCINEKSLNYKCKLYEVIRNNGGWINWNMEIINFFNCKNHYEARKKEQEYFVSLNATLNSIEPYAIPNPKEIIVKNKIVKEILHCKECNKYFNNMNLLETHNKTNKHIKRLDMQITDSITQKPPNSFSCINCDFYTSNKKDFNKHCNTKKHINNHNIEYLEQLNTLYPFCCKKCNKGYTVRNSLWYHEKKCVEINTNDNFVKSENDEKIIITESQHIEKLTNVIMELVKSNTELQKQTLELQQQLLEVCKTR